MSRSLSLTVLLALAAGAAPQTPSGLPERLTSPQASLRSAALRSLGEQKVNLKWLSALQNSLKDGDRGVVLESLRVWAKVGSDYAYEFASASYDEDEDAGKEAARGKLQAWHREIIDLFTRLIESADEPLRREALRTICKLTEGADLICPPAGRCGTGAELTLSYKVDTALEQFSKTYRSEFLALLNDKDPDVVFNALCHLSPDRWRSFGARAKTYLASPDKRFRAIGMWILRESPLPTRLDLIVPFLDDEDQDVRLTAVANLTMTEAEARQIVLSGLRRPVSLRTVAIGNLGYEATPERDDLLKRLVNDPSPEIRNAALGLLLQGDEEKNVAIVQRSLDDPSPLVRATALTAAASAEMPGLLPYVKAGLVSPNRELRESALWSTMRVKGSEELTPEMVRAVDLGVGQIWMASPNFDDPRFAYLVGECLQSKNPDVRQLLCFYASEEGRSKPVDLMIRLACDPDPDVARLAVNSLGSLSDQKAYDTLVDLTASAFLDVRTAAIAALGETKRASALPILRGFLTDESREIRRAAKCALERLKANVASP